jgi:hypothetical protein
MASALDVERGCRMAGPFLREKQDTNMRRFSIKRSPFIPAFFGCRWVQKKGRLAVYAGPI